LHADFLLSGHSVTYSPFGTFTKDPPFHKHWMLLPQSPSRVGTKFHLYTRRSGTDDQILDSLRPATIHASTFNSAKKTVFISHGFTGGIDSPMNKPMKDALLSREDVNVVVVAWYNGSHVAYSQAAANCRLVGAQIAHLIEVLHNEVGLAYSYVHIIGYSLGAHVAGYAGRALRERGHPIARITGLDAAAPLFEHEDDEVRLDKTDAEFVDGIHTSTQKVAIATGIGMIKEVGNIDFYVNGGSRQPGCLDFNDGLQKMLSCSHTRSYELFTESINARERFKGYSCPSYKEFLDGDCTSCPSTGCPAFGYESIKHNGIATGKFYLKTSNDSPYLVDHYKVTFKTGSAPFGDLLAGVIKIKLTGTNATSKEITFNRRTMVKGGLQSFVAGARNIGEPSRVEVSHADLIQTWNLRKIAIQKFGSNIV